MKKIIAAMLAAALLLCGCGGKTETSPAPVSVPSGGWTPETLIPAIYIEGNKLSCPPVFGDFRKNVKFSENSSAGTDGTLTVPVYSKNESVACTLVFGGVSDFGSLSDSSEIKRLILRDTVGIGDEQISLNGLVMGDSPARTEELLGAPDDKPTDSTYIYTLGENRGEVTITFNREKVYDIFISLT